MARAARREREQERIGDVAFKKKQKDAKYRGLDKGVCNECTVLAIVLFEINKQTSHMKSSSRCLKRVYTAKV